MDDVPAGATLAFDDCDQLGAANLRGTGFAARDIVVRELRARIGGDLRVAEVNVTGIAGFLLAKVAAARSRRKPKDWYDLAFVLLHNDIGGPQAAAGAVIARFGNQLTGEIRLALDDLAANFKSRDAQGPQAYAAQMLLDHPELECTGPRRRDPRGRSLPRGTVSRVGLIGRSGGLRRSLVVRPYLWLVLTLC